jgi:NAD(P)-dependent dehydrogenase (short-subunit alcohol dehydrogenase family)
VARVALVTGGAGAIGGAIVEMFAERGFEVAIIDRTGDFACDLADAEEVERVVGKLLARFGRCDVFVHAAAAFDNFALVDFDLASWRHMQAVNVESALLLCRAFIPRMTERGYGRIVFITSNTVWSSPGEVFLPYIASKAALEGIARVLARAHGRDGITVNAVEPGLTRVPRTEANTPPAAFAAVVAAQALPRSLEPGDTAAAVAFLCSDEAAAITGQALCVDGGQIFR